MTKEQKIEFAEKQIEFLEKHRSAQPHLYPDSNFVEAITYWQNEIKKLKTNVNYIGVQKGFDGAEFALYNIDCPESKYHNSTIMINGPRNDNAALIAAYEKVTK